MLFFVISFTIIIFPFLLMGVVSLFNLWKTSTLYIGNLLTYYGTAFGIFGSFVTYKKEERRKQVERDSEVKPNILVKVKKNSNGNNSINILLEKLSTKPLINIFIFDVYISNTFKSNEELKEKFVISNEQLFHNNCCVETNEDIIDANGNLKEVQVYCEDVDGHFWSLNYTLIPNCDKKDVFYYSLTEMNIV